jgi:hypothetical protein
LETCPIIGNRGDVCEENYRKTDSRSDQLGRHGRLRGVDEALLAERLDGDDEVVLDELDGLTERKQRKQTPEIKFPKGETKLREWKEWSSEIGESADVPASETITADDGRRVDLLTDQLVSVAEQLSGQDHLCLKHLAISRGS